MQPYSFYVTWSERDKAFVATCPEFPTLSAFGNTPAQAIEEAGTALSLFVEEYEADGVPLPEPRRIPSHSGQIRLRMPKYLHAQLAHNANQEGVSLNTLIVSYLSEAVGATRVGTRQEEGGRRSAAPPVASSRRRA